MTQIVTTYADLRPDDLVVDKSGKAWPIQITAIDPPEIGKTASFWLCDPVTKVATHPMTKDTTDTVTVSRVSSHADEAVKLEAEFPSDAEILDAIAKSDNFVTLDEAVAAVEAIGGTVEAEVTAEEVDAAAAATDDAPVRLPAFESMTPLEARSHLYLVHGCYAADLKGRDELAQMHADAHRQHAEGKLQSKYVPHVHEEA